MAVNYNKLFPLLEGIIRKNFYKKVKDVLLGKERLYISKFSFITPDNKGKNRLSLLNNLLSVSDYRSKDRDRPLSFC